MSDARLLWDDICVDEQVNQLTDTAALIYTWALPHQDDENRIPGSPAEIRALVVPARDYSVERVAGAIQEWISTTDGAGNLKPLVEHYIAEGRWVIQFLGGAKRQKILKRIWRARPSMLPPPPAEGFAHPSRLARVTDSCPVFSPKGSSEARPPDELPIEKVGERITLVRTVCAELADADDRTALAVASVAKDLPDAALYSALEALKERRERHDRGPLESESRYLVGTLKTMRKEGQYSHA